MTVATSLQPAILTVGHSARPLDEFIRLLQENGTTRVLDVRKMPRSRPNPQFNGDTLADALAQVGIGYTHLPALGGLRRPRANSPNGAWRNRSFQGYADHMQTPEFAQGLEEVIRLAAQDRVALMCAEAVPWRCHRSLIADALAARGLAVANILGPKRCTPHRLRPWARLEGTRVTYPVDRTATDGEGGERTQAPET